MAESGLLARRFVVGSNNISFSTFEQHDFFVGMPRSLRQANELNRQIVAAQTATLAHLQDAHSGNMMAFNEIRSQLSTLQSLVVTGFGELSNAIFHLEDTLCAELAEVKWVLGQIDTRLGELVHLVKFPRETEAKELIEDGVKALATGNLDDAEACLRNAVETKRTSFQAHMNLAFVFLHKDEAASAITHFKKAADYAPPTDRDGAQVLALQNLARAHFAARDFEAARSVMEHVLDLMKRHGSPPLHAEYQYATYCAQAGDPSTAIQIVVGLCMIQPTYFATASTDADFAPIRAGLLAALDHLARREHEKASELLKSVESDFAKSLAAATNRDEIASEVSALNAALSATRKWLEARNYTDSVRAVSAGTKALSIVGRLPWFSSTRQRLSAARDELSAALEDERKAEAAYRPVASKLSAQKQEHERPEKSRDEFWGINGAFSKFFGPLLLFGIPVVTIVAVIRLGWLAILVPVIAIAALRATGGWVLNRETRLEPSRSYKRALEADKAAWSIACNARSSVATLRAELEQLIGASSRYLSEINGILSETPPKPSR